MFPDDEEVVNEGLTDEDGAIPFDGKAFLYDYKKNDFVLRNGAPVLLEGKEALKAWIEKCIRTVKFKAAVHKNLDYGPQIEDLIGSVFDNDFIQAEIEREVSDALLKNPYILNINDFTFEIEGSKLSATITITTIYDNEPLEVTI